MKHKTVKHLKWCQEITPYMSKIKLKFIVQFNTVAHLSEQILPRKIYMDNLIKNQNDKNTWMIKL